MKNLAYDEIPADAWNSSQVPESISRVYNWVENQARSTINWYLREKDRRAWKSKFVRVAAIVLYAAGGLAPICGAGLQSPSAATRASQLGYVFLGLATACLALDKYFGISTGYLRYMTTALSLQRVLGEFHLDWIALLAKTGGLTQSTPAQPLIARLHTLLAAVRDTVDRETQAWVAEFQTNLGELEKLSKLQQETLKPGSIDLTIPNGAELDGDAEIWIDDILRDRVRGTKCQLTPIFPGQHRVEVKGKLHDKAVEASSVIVVYPGAPAGLTLAAR